MIKDLHFARLAKLAYKKQDHITETEIKLLGYDQVAFIESDETDTEVFLAWNTTDLTIVFRGTEPREPQDVSTDLKVRPTRSPIGRVHRGFWGAWESVCKRVGAAMPRGSHHLHFVGHSLGGALALVAARDYKSLGLRVDSVVVFGAPRVFYGEAAEVYDGLLMSRTRRYVNSNDPVPLLPPLWMGYRHAGTLHYYDRNGEYRPRIGFWARWWDRLRGRGKHFGTIGTAGFTAHSIRQYIKTLR